MSKTKVLNSELWAPYKDIYEKLCGIEKWRRSRKLQKFLTRF